jgi:hypothetical protein
MGAAMTDDDKAAYIELRERSRRQVLEMLKQQTRKDGPLLASALMFGLLDACAGWTKGVEVATGGEFGLEELVEALTDSWNGATVTVKAN